MKKYEMMDKIIQYQMREIKTSEVAKYLDEYTEALLQQSKIKNMNVIRPFSDLIKKIEHKDEKFIPILQLAKISKFLTLKNVSFDRSTLNPKGCYYVSNIKREIETIDKFCAFVFSEDMQSFYFVSTNGRKEFVPDQVLLFQKLREWGFIE